MKKKISISFIVPVYNCAKFLPEAINSIFDGNFVKGDEIVIVDDASTDNTFKVAKSLQKIHHQIKIFRHHYNKGSAAAGRNTGIDNSNNELIFCLDADNVLCPDSVPKLKQYLINKKADAAAFGELHYFIDNIQNVTHKWTYMTDIDLYNAINNATTTPCASGNYLFTKMSWLKAGRYNETSSMVAYDSLAFGLYQLFTGAKMVTMPETFYYHRYGYESTYLKAIKKNNPSLTILQTIIPFLHLFEDDDVDYIMSKKARYLWFDKIKNHQLRLKKHTQTTLINSLFEKTKKKMKIL